MLIISIVFAISILVGIYCYKYLKTHIGRRITRIIYTVCILTALIYAVVDFTRNGGTGFAIFRSVALVVIFYATATIPMSLIALSEDIFYAIKRFALKRESLRWHSRMMFFLSCAMALGGVGTILFGMAVTKTHWKVYPVEIHSQRIPQSFDSLRIVQISDLHLGSFSTSDSTQLRKAIDIIHSLSPDMIVFTGDIVNSHTSEMEPWLPILSSMQAPMGKYTVMGNHDYCHYAHDLTPEQMEENVALMKQYYASTGWKMLDNAHTAITKNNDTIYLAGVENWGKKPFPSYGDIDAAMQGIPHHGYTILLSHNPDHFKEVVSLHPQMVDLTLSGHTHAMQFGIEINEAIRWSPMALLNEYWAGLFEKNGRLLYVNRGLGFHFLPARVGIRPEITLITLHSQKQGERQE